MYIKQLWLVRPGTFGQRTVWDAPWSLLFNLVCCGSFTATAVRQLRLPEHLELQPGLLSSQLNWSTVTVTQNNQRKQFDTPLATSQPNDKLNQPGRVKTASQHPLLSPSSSESPHCPGVTRGRRGFFWACRVIQCWFWGTGGITREGSTHFSAHQCLHFNQKYFCICLLPF